VLTIYSLSAKGIQASQPEDVTLPAELRQLLRLVDGRRTRGELIAALRKPAFVADRLRWLEASGYIESRQQPATPAPQPAAAVGTPDTAPSNLSASGDADRFHAVLSRYMLRAIGRWLRESGQEYRRHIESAASVEQLLPHLYPLTNSIAARAGAQAGADFAENAAFILERLADRTDQGTVITSMHPRGNLRNL